MNTWGILNRTNNMTRSWFSSISLYMYHSYIFFYFKESTTVTTDKQRAKQIQQKKHVQKYGGPVAPNSICLGPSNIDKVFLFLFLFSNCFKIISTSYFFPFKIKGRELPRFLSFFSFSFFHRRTKVSPLRL